MQNKEVGKEMEVEGRSDGEAFYSTSESSSEEERTIPVAASTLRKSSADLSKESERLKNTILTESSQLSQDERALLEREINLLQQGNST